MTVTGSGGTGSDTATWTTTAAPVNTAAPVLSGPAQPGWAQTGTDGTWKGTPAPTFAYQWADCDAAGANCTSIAGANLSSYWPVSSDFGSTLELTVTATNSAGSQSATSAPSAVITAPPSYSALPLITGTLAVDQTLSSDGGTWTGYPTPTLTYQWERCTTDFMHMCSPIAGASTSSYQLTGADLGQGMQVQVSATNSAGVRLAFRAPTGPVTPAPPAPPDAGTTSVSDLVVQGGVATFTFHGTVNPNANAAVSYGYSCGGPPARCMTVAGHYGHYIASNRTAAGRVANRRVHVTYTVTQ